MDTNIISAERKHRPAEKTRLAASGRLAVSLILALAYLLANKYLRIHLPGVTDADIRPQVVLLIAAGYFLGPVYGFLAGFLGDMLSAVWLGYGFKYLFSWNIGNGLIGALICLYPYRKKPRIERIGELALLIAFLVIVNTASFAYAAAVMLVMEKSITFTVNFNFFFLPVILTNIINSLMLFPLILLFSGRFKMNYPVKLALSNYYLATAVMIVVAIVFHPELLVYRTNFQNMSIEQGNAVVEMLTGWTLLLVCLLITGLFISSWMSKAIVIPIEKLDKAVRSVLTGEQASLDELEKLSKRQDEIGILGYTIRLLSEKLLETEALFKNELKKKMGFIDEKDAGTDILISSLGSKLDNVDIGNIVFLSGSREISNITAISLTVLACGLEELAATYSEAKILKSFENMDSNITGVALSLKERQALAVAIDLNLSFSGRLKLMNILEPLSRDFAFHLIERADEFLSIEKNYIGYVTDPDIVSKISGIWDKHPKVRNEILDNVLNRAFRESLITGCLIKNKHDLANFDSNLTISYSHSNIKHVKQLIGLLASEHLQAKLQLEPKRSSFIYLKEWERMPDINLESIEEGIDIAHKDEFDIVMEFTSQEHRDGFRNLIESYARTEAENDHNVLYESWRQPLFTSKIPLAGYTRIGEIIIRDASHLAVSYVREKEIAEKLEWFSRETKDMEVTVSHVWVNEAFFRYLDRNSS